MNLLILIFFGCLATVCAIYKIPKYDACTLGVLLCDDYTKPLTPIDNSTLEMFETLEQLNAVCDELSQFRDCLKIAETFCHEISALKVGFELLNNRRLAFDLCEPSSLLQLVYMTAEGCVNKYSHSAIEFCTDKAVEKVGLNFDLRDYESECRFLGTMQHCHIAIITDQCGSVAGKMLEKLVVFRGERDFMCIEYEKEKLKNLEIFHATMNSYVQQFKNSFYQDKKKYEAQKNEGMKNIKMLQQSIMQSQNSDPFQSRISPMLEEYSASDNDIRYWGSKHDEGNLYKESNKRQSTRRIGVIPSYVHKFNMDNQKSELSDEKYNFYMPETFDEYPVDTVIHFISSGEGNLENQFEVGDSKASEDFVENRNIFLVDEMFLGENTDEPSTPRPSTSSEPPSHLYRPYELYRPRIGETFAAEEQDKSSKKPEIKEAVKSINPNEVSSEVVTENDCVSDLYDEETCPILPENISKLVSKPGKNSRINCFMKQIINMANQLDTLDEPKSYEKYSILDTMDDKTLNNMIWKDEEVEDIYTDNERDWNEEIYVVTPSTEIEISQAAHQTAYEDSDARNLNENNQVSNSKGKNQDFIEAIEDGGSRGLTLENDSITKERVNSARGEFLDLISKDKHPFSDKFDSSDNHKGDSKEKCSTKTKVFSRRSSQKYEMEENFFNAFEMLAKVKVNMSRMRKVLREMKTDDIVTDLEKIEL